MASTGKYWIAVGDVHESTEAAKRIPGVAEAEGLIVSGDLTNHGGRRRAEAVLQALQQANPRVLAQIGNMDLAEVDAYLDEKGVNIHARAVELAPGAGVLGVGASTPTPFNTPSEYPDSQLKAWLEQAYAQAARFDQLLLVAHDPPHNTACDQVAPGQHVGSKAVRAFIERVQPDACLCGHIHEARASDAIGRTVVVNPGTLASGGYAVIRLGKEGFAAELGKT